MAVLWYDSPRTRCDEIHKERPREAHQGKSVLTVTAAWVSGKNWEAAISSALHPDALLSSIPSTQSLGTHTHQAGERTRIPPVPLRHAHTLVRTLEPALLPACVYVPYAPVLCAQADACLHTHEEVG